MTQLKGWGIPSPRQRGGEKGLGETLRHRTSQGTGHTDARANQTPRELSAGAHAKGRTGETETPAFLTTTMLLALIL